MNYFVSPSTYFSVNRFVWLLIKQETRAYAYNFCVTVWECWVPIGGVGKKTTPHSRFNMRGTTKYFWPHCTEGAKIVKKEVKGVFLAACWAHESEAGELSWEKDTEASVGLWDQKQANTLENYLNIWECLKMFVRLRKCAKSSLWEN